MKKYQRLHFQGQKNGEEILLVTRRHWFDIFIQFFIVILMIFLLIFSSVFIPILFSQVKTDANVSMLFSFLENLFGMMIWIVVFLIWIDYYFDVWIITDKRIVNIEQKGLFSREVSELELGKIQDVTTDVKGVIPTFLNYGDLYVQTAAERERFVFHNVPNPYGIKDLIMNLQKEQIKEEADELGEMIHKKIHEEIN